MKYLHSMLRIKNLDESVNFFKDILKMREVKRYENEKGRFTLIFLAAQNDYEGQEQNSPLLELTYNWPDQEQSPKEYSNGDSFGHLAYEVDDIYLTCQEIMNKGITINRPPRDGRMAFIKTPDGISIELLQKGRPLEVQAPWSEMPNHGSW